MISLAVYAFEGLGSLDGMRAVAPLPAAEPDRRRLDWSMSDRADG